MNHVPTVRGGRSQTGPMVAWQNNVDSHPAVKMLRNRTESFLKARQAAGSDPEDSHRLDLKFSSKLLLPARYEPMIFNANQ